MSVVMHLWALQSVYESVTWLKTRFGWLDFPGNQVWRFRNRLGFMNTTCNPSEHPFGTGSLCCKRRAWGHKGRYDRSSAGFCRNLWFWCPQKEGMLQFTASLGSCFYAELSGKKKLSPLVKMQRWWFLFCFVRAQRGLWGWRPLAISDCFPLSIL